MSTDAPTAPARAHPPVDDRYADLSLLDRGVVIYDREAVEAWIQSDVVVPIAG